MLKKGLHHIGLATHDMDGTKDFYERVLGFETVRFDRFDITEGGYFRHIFLDTGGGELISFLEANEVDGVPAGFDTGLNTALGVPAGFYHLAFEADSVEHLEEIRRNLEDHGVEVSPVLDHDWCRSLYFFDPVNGLYLEFSVTVREFTEDDRTYQYRFSGPLALLNASVEGLRISEKSRHEQVSG